MTPTTFSNTCSWNTMTINLGVDDNFGLLDRIFIQMPNEKDFEEIASGN